MEVELGQRAVSGNQAKLRQHYHPQRAAQAHLSPEGNREEGAFSLDHVKRKLKARERQDGSGKGRGVGTTLTGGTTLKSEGHSSTPSKVSLSVRRRNSTTAPLHSQGTRQDPVWSRTMMFIHSSRLNAYYVPDRKQGTAF